jgi:hypothetical protein
MFLGSASYLALERIGFKDSPILHIVLALSAVLLFFATTISWPFAAFIRWRCKVKLHPRTRIPRWAYLFAWSAGFLFIAMAGFLAIGLSAPNAVAFGIPMWMRVNLMLSILAAVLVAVSLVYTVVIWRSSKGSIWGRIFYTVVTLALISATWQLNHWNLIGFRY